MTRSPAWPIVIAGGGAPGLALALALARALGRAVAVTVADPGFGRELPEGRAFALSPAAAAQLDGLGVWDAIRPGAQPIASMRITDSRLEDAVRPAYLDFDGDGAPLAYMVEAATLLPALRGACRESGAVLLPAGVSGFAPAERGLAVATSDGGSLPACLLVAADGARSRLREAAGIGWVGRPYRQSGIVATVLHERDHEGRAIQHFLPAGPFAMLPLVPEGGRHRSSIVWTEREDRVPGILALDAEAADREIARRLGPDLGETRLATPLAAHPLGFGLARDFASGRLALLGDAAHEIHPLAGQGLNLGLADAASLAARAIEAARLGLDPGGQDVLAAYSRDRRLDAVALAGVTDGLNRLFSNDRLPLRALRDLGLGLVDRAPGLKGGLARRAMGGSRRARHGAGAAG